MKSEFLMKMTRHDLMDIVRKYKLGKFSTKKRDELSQMILESDKVSEEILQEYIIDRDEQKKVHDQIEQQRVLEKLATFKPGDKVTWGCGRRVGGREVYFGILDHITYVKHPRIHIQMVKKSEVPGSSTKSNVGSMDYSWKVVPHWDQPMERTFYYNSKHECVQKKLAVLEYYQVDMFQENKIYEECHYEQ